MKYCPSCGKPADDTAAFCQHCGHKFAAADPLNDIPLPPPSPQNINTPPPPPTQKATIISEIHHNIEPQKIEFNQVEPQKINASNIDSSNIRNPERRNARIGLGISLIGAGSMYMGISGAVDMMDGGGAMILIGIFALIMGIIIWVIFRRRAAVIDDIISGKNRVAAWLYDAPLWTQYTEREREARSARNKMTLGIIGVFIIIISVGMLIFADFDEASIAVAVGLIGFFAFLLLVAYLSVWLPYRRRSALKTGRVIFSPTSIWVEGDFYEWASSGTILENIEINKQTLIVEISAPSRTGRTPQTVQLPIPADQMPTAKKILQYFKK